MRCGSQGLSHAIRPRRGTVSAAARALSHEVVQTMFVPKLAIASAAVLAPCWWRGRRRVP
jgi:hypothetical protein